MKSQSLPADKQQLGVVLSPIMCLSNPCTNGLCFLQCISLLLSLLSLLWCHWCHWCHWGICAPSLICHSHHSVQDLGGVLGCWSLKSAFPAFLSLTLFTLRAAVSKPSVNSDSLSPAGFGVFDLSQKSLGICSQGGFSTKAAGLANTSLDVANFFFFSFQVPQKSVLKLHLWTLLQCSSCQFRIMEWFGLEGP